VSKSSKALLFGHSLWVYIQTMLDQFPGHPVRPGATGLCT
jgi:hypothetical protein